ncbi:MAG: hypothetical protein J0M04_10130 [Verrucomicrobia bacterium]|nr:hypothetical protein [Verrucomicrobiota bacterium]
MSRWEVPCGRQQGVERALAPAGWSAEVGSVGTVFTGSLGHGASAVFAVRVGEAGGPWSVLQCEARSADEVARAWTRVPGAAVPRALSAWTDATGLHGRFLVRPGSSLRWEHAPNLTSWTPAPADFPVPMGGNLVRVDRPLSGTGGFVRVKTEAPAVAETPELLAIPLAGTWTAPVAAEPEGPAGDEVVAP